MVLAEAPVKLQFSEVREQLNSSALHHVLTEVHHAVQIVEVSCFGVPVPVSIHCNNGITQRETVLRAFIWPDIQRGQLKFMSHTADNPLDAMDVSVGVEENAVRDISVPASSP